MENNNNNKKLNIVLFPWLAFGHIIPFLDLSKHLASRGHHIFFVSTPRNLQRIPKIPENIAPLITLVPLPLPRLENLPPNAEATSDVGFEIGTDLLKKAFDGLQQPMSEFLQATSSLHPLDWIIYDFCCYWLPPIADKLSIRKVYFSIFPARFVSILGPSTHDGEGMLTNADMLTTPPKWIPFSNSTVCFLPYEARIVFQGITAKTSSGVSDMFRHQTCIKSSDFFAVRSCSELEGEYLQLLKQIHEKPVFSVGLLPPSINETPEDDASNLIIGWLEKQKSESVVYVALGSEVEPSQEQLTELALGLELSQLPFFWVFRRSAGSTVNLPDGFEERTRDHGMIWKGWAPQLKILRHDSVGGFLIHVGWGSVIEALYFGKPMILLPFTVDQGINARFMEEKRVGIEIPRNEEDGSFTRSSVAESLLLVLQHEDGKLFKDEAKKISTIIANPNLHNQYIDKFIEHLHDHKP